MARTPSTMLPLGTIAPDFTLPDPENQLVSLEHIAGSSGFVVMFISNHCPFVIHLKTELATFAQDYAGQIGVVAIGSNDIEKYPQDGPKEMAKDVAEFGYPFPYLHDASQDVARNYHAACTPDFYLFDQGRRLVYRGQFDSSDPEMNIPSRERICDAPATH